MMFPSFFLWLIRDPIQTEVNSCKYYQCLALKKTTKLKHFARSLTTVPTPHLDGKHCVFGKVIAGRSVVRIIENSPVKSGDAPTEDIIIEACGELKEGEDDGVAKGDNAGDNYEDYPSDEEQDVENVSCFFGSFPELLED